MKKYRWKVKECSKMTPAQRGSALRRLHPRSVSAEKDAHLANLPNDAGARLDMPLSRFEIWFPGSPGKKTERVPVAAEVTRRNREFQISNFKFKI
jgi:hypothetical protein